MQRAASLLVGLMAFAYGFIVIYQIVFVAKFMNDRDRMITPVALLVLLAVGAVNLWVAARPSERAARIGRLIVTEAIVLCAAVAVLYLRNLSPEGVVDATLLLFLGAALAWSERAFMSRRAGG